METNETVSVEIVYIKPDSQNSLILDVAKDSTIQQAIQHSGILERCQEIDLEKNKVGIYSRIKSLNTVIESGDRIEIYRPLLADPKEARRQRAKKK
jgi:putative ubiquitin-RnfH superfamily antitoxin RatB of RatAB toxin-antitoxin module